MSTVPNSRRRYLVNDRANGLIAVPSFICLLVGCVSIPERPGFQDIQSDVAQRIDRQIVWNQNSPADLATSDEILQILREPLTVDEAVQIALLNNHNIHATYEELGIAQADLVQAGLLQNPVFEVQLRFPGNPSKPWELHVVQNFIDVFFIPLRQRIAAAAFEATKLRVANAVLELATHTRRAFYQLQGTQQLLEMRMTATQALEASVELAQHQHAAGNISDLDLANQRVSFEQVRIDLATTEAQQLEYREQLTALMGLWGPEASLWKIDMRLPELPTEEIMPEGFESLAVSQRLDLQAARQQIESLAQEAGLAQYSGLVPELNIGVHGEREPEGETTWGPSIGLPLPVFSQGQPEIARATARLRQSQQRYVALAVQIRSEVRAALNRMLAARQLAEQYQKVMLPLREQIVEEAQLHYNAMQIGPFQLLAAKQAELESGARYIETLANYWLARADLEQAVGGQISPTLQPTDHKESESAVSQEHKNHGGH